jgi:hypothetical protein
MAVSFVMPEQIPRMTCWATVVILSVALPLFADDKAPTAEELAALLSKSIADGDSATRLRMNIKPTAGGKKTVLQLQVKARRTASKSEVVYQTLWPKDRKGESFVLQKRRGSAPVGSALRPPKTVSPLNRANMKDSIFGSDLAYEDVIDNFFHWESQSLAGKEMIGRVECIILESKPGAKSSSHYGSVRSWIDPKKLVPLRIEKFSSAGKLAVRIDTDRVSKNDRARHVPSRLVVRRTGSGTETEVEGSDIRHSMKYSDKDFTPDALTDFKIPR